MVFSLQSPKRAVRLASTIVVGLTVARVVVLVCESYTAVRAERASDRDLLKMCDAGEGAESADFRSLCIKKRSEQAAPVLLKALLRACRIAFADFCESLSSPWKVAMLVLFTLSGITAPLVKAVAVLAVRHFRGSRRRHYDHDSGSESEDDGAHDDRGDIVMISPSTPRSLLGRVFRRQMRRMRGQHNSYTYGNHIELGERFDECDEAYQQLQCVVSDKKTI